MASLRGAADPSPQLSSTPPLPSEEHATATPRNAVVHPCQRREHLALAAGDRPHLDRPETVLFRNCHDVPHGDLDLTRPVGTHGSVGVVVPEGTGSRSDAVAPEQAPLVRLSEGNSSEESEEHDGDNSDGGGALPRSPTGSRARR